MGEIWPNLLAEFTWPDAIAACALFVTTAACVSWCYYWWARTERIKDKGWPPPHCDADGDQVEQDK